MFRADFIAALHQSCPPSVFVATGGGAGAIAAILSVPGASRLVLEAHIPYAVGSLTEFLGHPADGACSAQTARDLARRARERATRLRPGAPALGVAVTASLATDRPKRGDHRFHVALAAACNVRVFSLILTKNERSRAEEEEVLDRVLLNCLAEHAGIAERLNVPLRAGEIIEQRQWIDQAAWPLDRSRPIRVDPLGRWQVDSARPVLLVAGSFNPLHEGHWGLGRAAEKITGRRFEFELSLWNVDKPSLRLEEARCRLAQFAWRGAVWLTHAPTFAEKAELFAGCWFAVGADTALRVVDERYYGGAAGMCAALERIRRVGGRFVVAERRDAMGRILGLADLPVPASFHDLFVPISGSEFHLDVSSTELRLCGSVEPEDDA